MTTDTQKQQDNTQTTTTQQQYNNNNDTTTTQSQPVDINQLKELIEYLSHSNPLVRIEALNILTRISNNDNTISILLENRLLQLLRTMLTSSKETVEVKTAVLSYCINISDNLLVVNQMINKYTFITLCYDYVVNSNEKYEETIRYIELYIILLSNITRIPAAISMLLQEHTNIYGLHFLRLLNRFFTICEQKDYYCNIGNIISNISTNSNGRKLLIDQSRDIINKLKLQILSPNTVRRHSILLTFKNLFCDYKLHTILLDQQYDLYYYVVYPIVGDEPLNPDTDYIDLVPDNIKLLIDSGKKRDPSVDCRRIVLDIINAVARNKYSRVIFRNKQIYPLLRNLHKYEEQLQLSDYNELDNIITELVTEYFLQREADDNVQQYNNNNDQQDKITEIDDDEPPPLIDISDANNSKQHNINTTTTSTTNQQTNDNDDSDDDLPPPLVDEDIIPQKSQSHNKVDTDMSYLDYIA